ncbi:MAG: sodium:solute symporter [Candidatus Omnitrophica bacterium]|nr:sodium:solute symporter [Candidatus Omnitrophota bacterium]MCA9446539.1 sodium:solute symporter [Candidatus Omnitrophota bacterium]
MLLRTGDLITIIVYFVFTMGIGFWFMRRNKSTDDYFKGGGKIPFWAAGMSLLATAISSISFLAYPGIAYASDWSLIVPGLMLPFAALIGAFVFAPFYRASRFTSAYEYLEGRFSPGVRMYAVVLYLIQQVWRLGSVLYLLSIPIKLMTGVEPFWVILVVGICTTVYCFVGGLEAVIWTDVVQTFVLLSGGLITVLIVFFTPGVGPGFVFDTAVENHKFNITANTDFTWFTEKTIWVLILYGLVQNVQEHVSDQIKVQRYCSVKDETAAKRAVMFNGILCIPVWFLFMFVGTCLYAFYKVKVDPTVAGIENPDEVFPHFIITQMPVGLSGLVIAAVMAAAMSTLSSSMNSSATVLTVDIVKRYLAPNRDDHYYLNIGKFMTALGGVLMIVTALVVSKYLKEAFLPISFFITSLTFGGLGGLFCIGFFSTRANARGIAIGLVATVAVTIYLALSDRQIMPEGWNSPTHNFMIGVFSNFVAFFVGLFASLLFARPPESKIRKATFWTLEKE